MLSCQHMSQYVYTLSYRVHIHVVLPTYVTDLAVVTVIDQTLTNILPLMLWL